MTFFLLIGAAQASSLGVALNKGDYLDWEYAVSLWTKFDRPAALEEWDLVMPVYDANKDLIAGTRDEVLQKLANHPQGDLIKRGHDLRLVYDVWKDAYRSILPPGAKAQPWNQLTGWNCTYVKRRNIFTDGCNDMPDWRTEADIKNHNAFIARGGK
ncbi:hypothetical protein DYI21_12140 [Thalassospira tepidiphila]|jgi:hypothetical protein|uniref:hypothetical protein n=1 Tax=Thalassospira tepidiphila TaxID=393657 RepID=UPI000EDD4901|nr:hypothetical protein [Thalassospira tepidiphila]MBR9901817.1 hypothetical protein [Rhodospirillales bacterium]MBS8274336.1 hypothetical protein [Thalassospira tepidiphila]HCK18362.1 hypothetical protein [Thalassospira sp.]|tara:strand:- start:321 stop:788 length:468 start_codon:yes stop_codon:yes gene_type:complete